MLDFKLIAPLSPYVISTLIIIAFLSVVFIVVGIKVSKLDPSKTPKGLVFLCVTIVDFFTKFLGEYISGKRLKFFGPYLFTIITFLALANTVALFGLTPPLANVGIAMSFSVLTFFMIKVAEVKFQGIWTKIKGLAGPVKILSPIMIPINLIGEISTPFSMGLRLFVNLMSGTVIAGMVFALGAGISAGFNFILGLGFNLFASVFLHIMFDIFFGLIQAFVFFMLSTVNLSMASEA